ncbi:MAG: hypothetical protein HZB39_12445 [Planctomycetes bacterium]|nr:hypothetical protein [Planctomycetota bacterium]
MNHESRSVEERLAEVLQVVRELTRRIDEFGERLGALEVGSPRPPSPVAAAPPGEQLASAAAMMSWVGQSRVLQRIAMVSFVLVLALVLRTLTDSQWIGAGVGVAIGILYSGVLLALGAWLLLRHRRGQRVLPICGAILLCSVALEAHGRFKLISAETVNWILIADLLVAGAIGLRFRMGSIVSIAVLAPGVSALIIGFPNLRFPTAAALFLFANVVAHLARRVGRLQWLSWTTFTVTLCFWFLWSLKARVHLLRPESVPAIGLGVTWFVPWLVVFAVLYAGTAMKRALATPRGLDAFHSFLPTGNVMWAHSAAAAVLGPMTGGLTGLGTVALSAAATHVAFAALLWRRLRLHATGITSFTLAGAVALALAVPALVAESLLVEVVVLSAEAMGLAWFAAVCGSPGLRLCALTLQVVVGGLALFGGLYAAPPESLAASLGAALALAASGGWQYAHDRRHPSPEGSWFARVDPDRHAGILLLWTSALAIFGSMRLVLDRVLTVLDAGTPDAFQCGQSVILNGASIAMLAWGMRTRNRQVMVTAGLVAVAGGVKVLGSDLMSASGLPLVLAVFSFGLAAAAGSIVLGRLQRSGAGAHAAAGDDARRGP